jgi:hypothetical protein
VTKGVARIRSSVVLVRVTMRRSIVLVALVAAVAAATHAGAGAQLRPHDVSASRIVDRTFACSPKAFGGVGDLDVNVNPPRDFGFYEQSAQLAVRTGGFNPDSNLVLVRTRAEEAAGGWRSGPAGVYASSRRCAEVRAKPPLSSRGIGGAPTQWAKELDCRVRGRVVVRVRSVLQSPADWRRIDRFYAGARQPVLETRLAVRTQRGGKPIAYMEHDADGKVKLWYSPACS